MNPDEARRFLDGVLQNQALVIGGLLTIHAVDGDFICRLLRSTAAIRRQALRKVAGLSREPRGKPERTVQPPRAAIEAFLEELHRA